MNDKVIEISVVKNFNIKIYNDNKIVKSFDLDLFKESNKKYVFDDCFYCLVENNDTMLSYRENNIKNILDAYCKNDQLAVKLVDRLFSILMLKYKNYKYVFNLFEQSFKTKLLEKVEEINLNNDIVLNIVKEKKNGL